MMSCGLCGSGITADEKRELLSCFKSNLLLNNKVISLQEN